jgi:hypothetical protein
MKRRVLVKFGQTSGGWGGDKFVVGICSDVWADGWRVGVCLGRRLAGGRMFRQTSTG